MSDIYHFYDIFWGKLPMINSEGPKSLRKGEWNPLSPSPTHVRSRPIQPRPSAA